MAEEATKKPRNPGQPKCPGCSRYVPKGANPCPHCGATINADGSASYGSEGKAKSEKKARAAKGADQDAGRDGDRQPDNGKDAGPSDSTPAGGKSFFDW